MEKNQAAELLDKLLERYPALAACREELEAAYRVMEACYAGGGKLLIAGNGGSAADGEHIAGELMKRLALPRPVDGAFRDRLLAVDSERGGELARTLERGLPAIPLAGFDALTSAYLNDVGGQSVFAQKVLGLGRPGDVLLAITTSGGSENILRAAVTAKALDMKVVALTGRAGDKIAALADVTVKAPETETYLIQELHLPIYHCWCAMLERRFFGGESL